MLLICYCKIMPYLIETSMDVIHIKHSNMVTSSDGNIFRITSRFPVPGEFPAQRPVTRSFDVFVFLSASEYTVE